MRIEKDAATLRDELAVMKESAEELECEIAEQQQLREVLTREAEKAIAVARQDAATWRARAEALETALAKYGKHSYGGGCHIFFEFCVPVMNSEHHGQPHCTCGLDQALAPARGREGAG